MLAATAIDVQRGFVPGWQLVQKVFELDTYARWFGAAGHEHFEPLDLRIRSMCAAAISSNNIVTAIADLSSPNGTVGAAGHVKIVQDERAVCLQAVLSWQPQTKKRAPKNAQKWGAQESLNENNAERPRKPVRG